MGFLSNLADEAGKKTGKAIGNKLFGRYADDLRIGVGDLDDGASSAKAEAKKVKAEGKEKRKELKLQEQLNTKKSLQNKIDEIQSMVFDTQSVKANINAMMQLSSIIESFDDDDIDIWDEDKNTLREQLFKSAQSKFNMGINLCKAIDPTDPSIIIFENVIRKKQQEEELKKKEEKKNDKLGIWLFVGSIAFFILLGIILSICY